MPDPPSTQSQPAQAAAGAVARLSPPPQILPIVVVPGIMGTRLRDPEEANEARYVWNPRGRPFGHDPGTFAAVAAVIQRAHTTLVPLPDPLADDVPERHRRLVREVPGYWSLVLEYYGALVRDLHQRLPPLLLPHGIVPKFSVAGYDWRQSNSHSAETLRHVVDTAYRNAGNRPVIIIAHSMGGLVSRYYCRTGGASKVRALFLVGSPTLGAPKSYLTLKLGMDDPLKIRWGMTSTVSVTGSRDFARNVFSIYQLLPTWLYGRRDPFFVSFNSDMTGVPAEGGTRLPSFSNCSNTDQLYADIYTGLNDVPSQRGIVSASLLIASMFHSTLARSSEGYAYMPDKTYAVYGTGLSTIVGARLDDGSLARDGDTNVVSTEVEAARESTGDQTVPELSANPDGVRPAFVGTHAAPGVEHSALTGDPGVIAHLLRTISSADFLAS